MVATILEYSYTLVTVALLAYTLRRTLNKKHTQKEILLLWLSFGFIFNLYSLSWLYSVYPLAWLPAGAMQFLGITLLHVLISFIASLGFIVVGTMFFYYFKHNKSDSRYAPLFFATSLTVAELIRSLLISLTYSGNGGDTGLHWSAGTIGNALSTTPFIEYAYFGGTYMLTFILGYLIYIFILKSTIRQYWQHAVIIIVGLFCIHYVVPITTPQKPLTIGVVTTDFPSITSETDTPLAREESFNAVHTLTKSLSERKPDIIVYPEDTRYVTKLHEQRRTELLSLFNDTLFIDGDTQRLAKGGFSNVSIYYEALRNRASIKNKRFLFPFNEYVPSLFTFIISPFVGKQNIETYQKQHTYTPLFTPQTHVFNGTRVGTLICSEVLSFQTIRSLQKEKPSLIFYQSHLDVFHNNPWFIMHMKSFTKIAGAQTRTMLIGSSNGAPSYIISPHGRMLIATPLGFSAHAYTVSDGTLKKEK